MPSCRLLTTEERSFVKRVLLKQCVWVLLFAVPSGLFAAELILSQEKLSSQFVEWVLVGLLLIPFGLRLWHWLQLYRDWVQGDIGVFEGPITSVKTQVRTGSVFEVEGCFFSPLSLQARTAGFPLLTGTWVRVYQLPRSGVILRIDRC